MFRAYKLIFTTRIPNDVGSNVFTLIVRSHRGGVWQSQVLFQVSGSRSFLRSTPVLGSFPDLMSEVLSRGGGVCQSWQEGTPVLARGSAQDWGTPSLGLGYPLAETGVMIPPAESGIFPHPWLELGYPPAGTGVPPPQQFTLRVVRLVRFQQEDFLLTVLLQVTLSHDKVDGAREDRSTTNNINTDLTGDPSMTVVPAINQYLSSYM